MNFPDPLTDLPTDPPGQSVVLAGGCFWCVEAVCRQLDGVLDAVSGYCGGTAATANYDKVCGGRTDHAEAVLITYDARKITFGQLLKIFFSVAHDPTQLNRQGNDIGRQYRSTIFFANEDQRRVAEEYIRQLNDSKLFSRPIATTLEPLGEFFPAEEYHQDFAARNPYQPYIAGISTPKVEKFVVPIPRNAV